MTGTIQRVFPVSLALSPIGFLFGVLAAQADWSALDVLFLSVVGFTGSGQFAFLGFFQQGVHTVGLAVVFLVILSMNLRYVPMALSASRPLQAPALYKTVLSHCLADESYATEQKTDDVRSRFLIRMSVFLSWVVSTTAGCYLSTFLPASVSKALVGFTFPISAILFSMSGLNLLSYVFDQGPASKSRARDVVLCVAVALVLMAVLGERYFWIPSIVLCYAILARSGGEARDER